MMSLRFCPACGTRLPQAAAVRFCSSCGEELSKYGGGGAGDAAAQPRGGGEAEEFFSVVLKTCGNKERLIKRLSGVLRRGAAATRMAVDMAPCIIIYKSKASDLQAALEILEDEQLHYSVLKGDFEAAVQLEEIFPGLHGLSSEARLALRNAPAALWLGERIVSVAPAVELGGEAGMLVVTDQALYFSGSGGRQPQWRIIPFSRLAEVVSHAQDGTLELINKEYSREEWLHSDDEDCFRQLRDYVGRALARQGSCKPRRVAGNGI